MLYRKPKSFLGKNLVGQVFLLIRAELLHHLGLVLALWLGVGDDSVPEGRKGDFPYLASFADRLATPDSLDRPLDVVLWSYRKDGSNKSNKAEFEPVLVELGGLEQRGCRFRGAEIFDRLVA
jgi:hypothetical protein